MVADRIYTKEDDEQHTDRACRVPLVYGPRREHAVKAAVRIGIFAGALALVLGGSFYLAPLIAAKLEHKPQGGPPQTSAQAQAHPSDHDAAAQGAPRGTDPDGPRDADLSGNPVVPLSAAGQGFLLVSDTTSFTAGTSQPFRFQVLGADGKPVQELTAGAEVDLNLVVVRRDGAGFQRVVPVRDMTGTWSTSLTLPAGGSYAAWVNFTEPTGQSVVLGMDLSVAGDFQPQAVPSPAPSAEVDGYHVELAGVPTIGTDSELALRVSLDGKPVTDLQSTDDTFAHLAVMRTGDLAFAFADADPKPIVGQDGAPSLRFAVHLPTAGTYWLFVEFRREGQVHTAALTATIAAPASNPTSTTTPAAPGGSS